MDIIVYALCKKYTDDSIMGSAGPIVGKSAFQIAVDNGFVGTEQQWLKSLQGKPSYINSTNYHWMVYDPISESYIDSGINSKGVDGHSPYIDSVTHNWMEFDDVTQQYIDTGINVDCHCNTTEIPLGADIPFIGTNYGGWKDGDVAPAAMMLSDFLKKMTSQSAVPPTYKQPTLAMMGSIPFEYELGSYINPSLTPIWSKNNAGATIQYQIKQNDVVIYTNTTISSYAIPSIQITEDLQYDSYVTYGEGEILPDSEGNPYPEGHILPGTIESNKIIYTAYRQTFGGVSSDGSVPETSDDVRNLPIDMLNPIKGESYSIIATPGTKSIVFTYPSSLGNITSIIQQSLGMDVKEGFDFKVISVAAANNYDPIPYNVYYITTQFPYAAPETFIFTI